MSVDHGDFPNKKPLRRLAQDLHGTAKETTHSQTRFLPADSVWEKLIRFLDGVPYQPLVNYTKSITPKID